MLQTHALPFPAAVTLPNDAEVIMQRGLVQSLLAEYGPGDIGPFFRFSGAQLHTVVQAFGLAPE